MLKNTKVYLFLAIIYTFVLLYFTFGNTTGVLPETGIKFEDKIFHFVAYTGFTILWCYYLVLGEVKNGLRIGFVATLVFGIFLELIQEVVNPLRNYDNLDLAANCFGVVVGTIIVVFYFRKRKLK
ncbi:VanZ family protein [Winogradskyella jejuensis]|uniref:VanZ like family protein n=1 Tax=Winogradskyella jejuensis TaxID=1089305 RepID=A0A1M5LUZ2_9FLAO|nr:hypothetical protein [Winogradskyella jejuensis]SHG68825.1 hypothetical protein SAMN05444148_0723 [Winogradskyella jejuensis]